jgi:hypothetical protein
MHCIAGVNSVMAGAAWRVAVRSLTDRVAWTGTARFGSTGMASAPSQTKVNGRCQQHLNGLLRPCHCWRCGVALNLYPAQLLQRMQLLLSYPSYRHRPRRCDDDAGEARDREENTAEGGGDSRPRNRLLLAGQCGKHRRSVADHLEEQRCRIRICS